MILNFKKKADKLQASIDQKANQADLTTLRNSVNQQGTELQVNLDQLEICSTKTI